MCVFDIADEDSNSCFVCRIMCGTCISRRKTTTVVSLSCVLYVMSRRTIVIVVCRILSIVLLEYHFKTLHFESQIQMLHAHVHVHASSSERKGLKVCCRNTREICLFVFVFLFLFLFLFFFCFVFFIFGIVDLLGKRFDVNL